MNTTDVPFQQIIDPIFGSLVFSAIVAVLPLILLFVLLGVFRVKAPKAALASLVLSMALAVIGWQMPFAQMLSATAAGAVFGLIPILWILVNALWLYKLTVATRWFEVLGRALGSITNDHRILAILIAFCFGALMEALAGFGAPVAISAAMLMTVGMKPIKAAMASLLANTAPVAFGAMAVPITALSGVTGLPVHDLSSMVGRQTPILAVIVPLVLVFIVDGKRGLKQTWPLALVAGLVFGTAQFIASNYLIMELTDVMAAVATVLAILVMLRFWKPSEVIGASHDAAVDLAEAEESLVAVASRTAGTGVGAGRAVGAGSAAGAGVGSGSAVGSGVGSGVGWGVGAGVGSRVGAGVGSGIGAGAGRGGASGAGSGTIYGATSAASGAIPVNTPRPSGPDIWMSIAPYLILTAIFAIAQIPPVKAWFAVVGSVTFPWPGLNVVDPAGNPIAAQLFKLDHLKATGTLLLLSGLITMGVYKIGFRQGLRIYQETLMQLRWTIVTVTAVLALSFVMNLSGQASTLGVALASAGGFFALLSPLIGWIGVALTGSDTSSNSLFGQLQVSAAHSTGLSPVLMAAANSSGGVIGKMLSVQNLAVAAAAIGMEGAESTLLRKLLGWSLGLLAFLTVLILLQSTPILGWMVP